MRETCQTLRTKPRSSKETLISFDTVGKSRWLTKSLGKFGLADCILFSFQHQYRAWRTFPPPGSRASSRTQIPHRLNASGQAAGCQSRASSATPQWRSPPRTPTPGGPFPFSCPDAVRPLQRVAPHLRRATPRKWPCGPKGGLPGAQPRRTRGVGVQRLCHPASISLPSPCGDSPRPTLTLSPQRRGPPWTWRPARQPEPSLRSPAASPSAGVTRSSGGRSPGNPTAGGPALGQRRGSNPTPSRPPRQPPPPAPPAPSPAPRTLAATNQECVPQLHFRTLDHVTQIAQALGQRGAGLGLASLGPRGGALGSRGGRLPPLEEGYGDFSC